MPRKKSTTALLSPKENGHAADAENGAVGTLVHRGAAAQFVTLPHRGPPTEAVEIPNAVESPALKTLKVAIIGKAPSSQQLAPYDDPSWEIWSLSDSPKEIPRWDRHFELHEIESRIDKWGKYWEFLQKDHGKPIYLQALHPKVPCGVLFPWRDFVHTLYDYYTNTVSWIIAYALHVGTGPGRQFDLTDIGLFGVDMAQHGAGLRSEYAHQRPSCEFYVGMAAGKGVRVHIPDSSDLLKARRRYAIDSDGGKFQLKCAARRKELQQEQQKWAQKQQELAKKQQEIQAELQTADRRQHVLAGALDNMDWVHEWR